MSARRLLPGSLRAQLALAIALVTVLAVAASFLALYSGTSGRLQAQIDTQLHTQFLEWRQRTAHSHLSTGAELTSAARQFIAGQRYHAESLLIVVQVRRGATVSNNTELVRAETALDHREPEVAGLLSAPAGVRTIAVAEAGDMRVLSAPIRSGARLLGTLRLADPLTPVAQAQASMRRTFLIVGAVALLAAIALGVALASLIAAPLRRMAAVASVAGAGDLSVRAAPVVRSGEIGRLASAFDLMLERLQRAFARQRDFVSDASHELRTPLAVLRAQVELLDREHDEQRRRAATTTLLRRLDELDRLVGDMLTLASAEAGQLVEPRTIELDEFFEDLRRDLPLFGEREFELQAVSGTLTADPDRLTQVLRNLLRNAVTHTGSGDAVTVRASAAGERLLITVSDSGPGIPAAELERIFERFHRGGEGRSRDTGGSGLGLAIARAIVEAHGGSIAAQSRPGEGATFSLWLPGYRPPRPPESASGQTRPGTPSDPHPADPRRE